MMSISVVLMCKKVIKSFFFFFKESKKAVSNPQSTHFNGVLREVIGKQSYPHFLERLITHTENQSWFITINNRSLIFEQWSSDQTASPPFTSKRFTIVRYAVC